MRDRWTSTPPHRWGGHGGEKMPRATREALEDLHLECLEVIEHFTIDEKLIEILNMGLLLGGGTSKVSHYIIRA